MPCSNLLRTTRWESQSIPNVCPCVTAKCACGRVLALPGPTRCPRRHKSPQTTFFFFFWLGNAECIQSLTGAWLTWAQLGSSALKLVTTVWISRFFSKCVESIHAPDMLATKNVLNHISFGGGSTCKLKMQHIGWSRHTHHRLGSHEADFIAG